MIRNPFQDAKNESNIKHPNQKVLDVADPKGKLTGADFKKLRSMKKEEVETLDEAKRLIATHGTGVHTAKVYKDPEWNEYQTHFFKNGKHMGEDSVHHTDDKDDAVNTAKIEIARMDAKHKEVKEEADTDVINERKKDPPGTTVTYDKDGVKTVHVPPNKAPGDKYTRSVFSKTSPQSMRPGARSGSPGSRSIKSFNKVEETTHVESIDLTDVDEIVIVKEAPLAQLTNECTYSEYLQAVRDLYGDDDAVRIANEAFDNNKRGIFVEHALRKNIQEKIRNYEKQGYAVSTPKYTVKDDKPYAEYTVTNESTGLRRKHIHRSA